MTRRTRRRLSSLELVSNRIEIFADVLCPFAHVGIHKVLEARLDRRGSEPGLWIRAWPLETVNGSGWDAELVAAEVEALRTSVAPELFAGFDATTFPATSLPTLAVAAAAYRVGPAVGEAVSLELRNRLFERGQDVADDAVLAEVCDFNGVEVTQADLASIEHDHAEGAARGVVGSPYFFCGDEGFFCPAFDVSHDDAGFHIAPDLERFGAFIDAAFDVAS